MLSWEEKLELRAEKRGIQLGEKRGIQLGERRLLKRVLRKKFGALPATIDEQLDALSTDQLEAAIEHVFGAASVQAVLDAVR